jgi:C-22 sterol desaturase
LERVRVPNNTTNMANVNGSFVSPSADATISPRLFEPTGMVTAVLGDFNVWKALLTLFIAAVIYDQCKPT